MGIFPAQLRLSHIIRGFSLRLSRVPAQVHRIILLGWAYASFVSISRTYPGEILIFCGGAWTKLRIPVDGLAMFCWFQIIIQNHLLGLVLGIVRDIFVAHHMFHLLSFFEVMIYVEHFTSGGLRVASTIPDMRDISHNCQKVFVIIVKKYIPVIIVKKYLS